MRWDIVCVRGHYEVYSPDGKFILSADSHHEALEELEEWESETIN